MTSANLNSARVLITGGTGLIGTALTQALLKLSAQVLVLTRDAHRASSSSEFSEPSVTYIESLDAIADEENIHYIVNLAGASISDRRWTEAYKKELLSSRLDTTDNIVSLLSRLQQPPRCVISGSAVGYYGDSGDEIVDENSPGRECFSHNLCQQWENHARAIESLGIPLAIVRLGVVFSEKGGAWQEFKKPLMLKASPVFGTGKQYLSWVHIDDVVSIFVALLEDAKSTLVNVVSPESLTYNEMSKVLSRKARCLLRPRLPVMVIKWVFGQMGEELFLASTRAKPNVLQSAGIKFKFSSFDDAIDDLM